MSPDFDRPTTWTLIYFRWGWGGGGWWLMKKNKLYQFFFHLSSQQQQKGTADCRLRKQHQATFLFLKTFMMIDPCYWYCSCYWSGLVYSFPPNKLLQRFIKLSFIHNIINQTCCNFYCHLVMILLLFYLQFCKQVPFESSYVLSPDGRVCQGFRDIWTGLFVF